MEASDNGQPQEPSYSEEPQSDLPEWFRQHQSELDKRFEGLAATLKREARKAGSESPRAKPETELKTDSQFGFLDGMKYGQLRSKLTEEVQQRVDMIAESDPGRALEMAELLTLMAPSSSGVDQAATPPPGRAQSPAPNTSPSHPETAAQFMDLVQRARTSEKAREQLQALKEDPSFDPTQLRRA